MEGYEKRKFPRLPLNVGVKYEISKLTVSKKKSIQTKNISSGGICIVALEEIAEGTIIDFTFALPNDDKIINAKGKIVWIKEFSVGDENNNKAYDLGVEFIQISKSDREKINQYVNMKLVPDKTKE